MSFAILAVLFAACGTNIEKYQERFNELSVEWNRTFEEARGINKTLGNAFSIFNSARQSLSTYAMSEAGVPAENEAQVSELLKQMDAYNTEITGMIQEINTIAAPFQTKKAEIEQLDAAINGEGEFEGDAKETLTTLESELSTAKTELVAFQEKLRPFQDKIDAFYDTVKTLTGEGDTVPNPNQ